MTDKLTQLLSDFMSLVRDREAGTITTEEEFVTELKKIAPQIVEELKNQKEPEVKE